MSEPTDSSIIHDFSRSLAGSGVHDAALVDVCCSIIYLFEKYLALIIVAGKTVATEPPSANESFP